MQSHFNTGKGSDTNNYVATTCLPRNIPQSNLPFVSFSYTSALVQRYLLKNEIFERHKYTYIWSVYWSAWAAITKHHGLGGLSNRNLL